MDKLIALNKPIGYTPLGMIKKLRVVKPELALSKIGYAGRLDPAAHGVLLLMIGEQTKKRINYLSLPKTYEFQAIFGLQTDTYDLLGYLMDTSMKPAKKVNLFVNTFVKKFLGKQLQTYPPFSSKTVQGKPLFWWAKQGKLQEITIPEHEIAIYDFTVLSVDTITLQKLEKQTRLAVFSVQGDFRQKEIAKRWDTFFRRYKPNNVLPAVTFRITCSSGTYIRELVHQMGKEFGCGAVASEIFRIAVGNYTIADTISI